jgi:hypothetical protein
MKAMVKEHVQGVIDNLIKQFFDLPCQFSMFQSCFSLKYYPIDNTDLMTKREVDDKLKVESS